jgi:hypothetical protein
MRSPPSPVRDGVSPRGRTVCGMLLSKEQALKVSKRTFVTIKVPELDGELRLAPLAAGPAMALQALNERKSKGEMVVQELMLLLIEKSLVDEKGDPLFDTASAREFLERISLDTMMDIMKSVPGYGTPKVPPGNSEASPVAA